MIIIFVQLILVSQLIVYFKFSLQKKNLSIDWKCLLNWEKKEKQMSNPFLCIQKQLELWNLYIFLTECDTFNIIACLQVLNKW